MRYKRPVPLAFDAEGVLLRFDCMSEIIACAISGERFHDGAHSTEDAFLSCMRRFSGAEGRQDAVDFFDIDTARCLRMIYRDTIEEERQRRQWFQRKASHLHYPALELRAHDDHSGEWLNRWENAGGRFPAGGDRMVAHLFDPVWMKISRFSTPWPPYILTSGDYGYSTWVDLRAMIDYKAGDMGIGVHDFAMPAESDIPPPSRLNIPASVIPAEIITGIRAIRGNDSLRENNGRLEFASNAPPVDVDFPPPVYPIRTKKLTK
jgi:hypothetical protein